MEGTREAILAVATRYFSEKEYAEVKLEDIAGEAHVTRAPLYYYFHSKEGLFNAVMAETLAEAYARYGAIFDRQEPVFDIILADYRCCLAMQGTWQPIWAQAERMTACQEEMRAFQQWLIGRKQSAFLAAKARGELRADCDISELITLIYIYFNGVLSTQALAETLTGFSVPMLSQSEEAFLEILRERYGPGKAV